MDLIPPPSKLLIRVSFTLKVVLNEPIFHTLWQGTSLYVQLGVSDPGRLQIKCPISEVSFWGRGSLMMAKFSVLFLPQIQDHHEPHA